MMGDVLVVVVYGEIVVDGKFPLYCGSHIPAVVGAMLWVNVDVVEVAVAVGEMVCHSVGPCEVEGGTRVSDLVVGVCKCHLGICGFLRSLGERVVGDVD